jgi:nicotinate phosphoribosyltransferase
MRIIQSLLDSDIYKLSMGNVVLKKYCGIPVDYKFIARSPLKGVTGDFCNDIENEIDAMSTLRVSSEDIEFLQHAAPYLTTDYLKWFRDYKFDPTQLNIVAGSDNVHIGVSAPWEEGIYWEVPLLAAVSELYYRKYDPESLSDISMEAHFSRTRQKGQKMAMAGGPPFTEFPTYAEFGTRRRRSFKVQDLCIQALNGQKGFVGTSNIHLAKKYGLKALGTIAHEFIMGVSALEGLLHANRFAMQAWADVYHGNLGTMLPDTFGLQAFLRDFNGYFARLWDSVRHDSGDPYWYGNNMIDHYEKLMIKPITKSLIYTNGLECDPAIDIWKHFRKKINVSFGIGTHFTNDFPDAKLPALNIVMKMIRCNNIEVVKLPDDPGKATGDKDALRVAKWTFLGQPLDG